MAEFKLGETYRDALSGVIGIAVGIYSDISSEQTVYLQPPSQDGIQSPKIVTVNLKFLQSPSGELEEPPVEE